MYRCNPDEITAALHLFFAPGDVFEIRALAASVPSYRHEHPESGYFDYEHIKDVPKALEDMTARGIYFTPNPVNPVLLARVANRMRPAPKNLSTSDSDIVCRRWLLIDCDAVRPSGISATDEEHNLAIEKAKEIRAGLKSLDWPEPVLLDSGNGAQLMYCIDLPTEDNGLVQSCLKALASAGNDKVQVDQAVHNPARIWRLPGTMNCKGENMPDRSHRMAKFLEVPEKLTIVSEEKLKILAGKIESKAIAVPDSPIPANNSFNLDEWISKYCPEAEGPHSWKEGCKWVFPVCPFNPEHDNSAAVITQQPSGAIGFKCHHNGCVNNDWKALRKLREPGYSDAPAILPEADISGIISQAKGRKPQKLLVPLNAAEWVRVKLPPPVPIVENIIDKGNKIQLLGDSKLGKSWFNLNLAVAIATGGNFLNWKIPRPRKVLLIQMEIGAVYYQERLKSVAKLMEIGGDDLFRLELINGRGLPPLLEGDIFYEFLDMASNYDVIFIDPLYKVHSGDENKVEDMKKPLLAFDRICETSGAAVVYTHHNPKGLSGDRKIVDRGSGSSVLARDYDTVISLSPHVQEGLLVLNVLPRNYSIPQPLSLVRDGLFKIVSIEPEELTSRTANERKKPTLLEAMICVRDSEIIRPGELLKAEELEDRLVSVCGLPIRMARIVRAEMVKQGEWVTEAGKRNSKLYRCGEIE